MICETSFLTGCLLKTSNSSPKHPQISLGKTRHASTCLYICEDRGLRTAHYTVKDHGLPTTNDTLPCMLID